MTRFWTTVLFAAPLYSGRPLDRHLGLPIGPAHFSRWIDLWTKEVDRHFKGERAEHAKRAALNMSRRMAAVLNASRDPDANWPSLG